MRYYDQIGLLVPRYTNPDSGYRYYSYDQFVQIDMIQFSKTLGYSLEEIGKLMVNKNLEELRGNLLAQREKAEEKRRELDSAILSMEHLLTRVQDAIGLKDRPSIYQNTLEELWVLVEPAQPGDDYESMDMRLRIKEQEHPEIQPTTRYGYILDFDRLHRGETQIIASFTECLPKDEQAKALLERLAPGTYECTQCKILQGEPIDPDFVARLSRFKRPVRVTAEEVFCSLTAWEECNYEISVPLGGEGYGPMA